MTIKITNQTQLTEEQKAKYKPLVDFFGLLLEWEMKDVHEKEEERKEVS